MRKTRLCVALGSLLVLAAGCGASEGGSPVEAGADRGGTSGSGGGSGSGGDGQSPVTGGADSSPLPEPTGGAPEEPEALAAAQRECGTVELSETTVVRESRLGEERPSALGGPLVDGLYVQTRYLVYSDFSSGFDRAALRVSDGGATLDFVAAPDIRLTYAVVAAAGPEILLEVSCPSAAAGQQESGSYSVVGEELWLFDETNVAVYTPAL